MTVEDAGDWVRPVVGRLTGNTSAVAILLISLAPYLGATTSVNRKLDVKDLHLEQRTRHHISQIVNVLVRVVIEGK